MKIRDLTVVTVKLKQSCT